VGQESDHQILVLADSLDALFGGVGDLGQRGQFGAPAVRPCPHHQLPSSNVRWLHLVATDGDIATRRCSADEAARSRQDSGLVG
jgi:hypothetical protein